MPQGDGLCRKGSFSSLGSGKDQCCSRCDSNTFSALDGASECMACNTLANFFSPTGASNCTYFGCGKLCADSVGVPEDCGTTNDCLGGDCFFIGIIVNKEAERMCEERQAAAACSKRTTRMLLLNTNFNNSLPVSISKSATNPFGRNLIALDVLFLPSDSSPVSPMEARRIFLDVAARGMLSGNISAVKIGDTIVHQRGPSSKTPSTALDVSPATFPLWATLLLSVSAAAVVIGTTLLRNDRALYKKLVNLIYKCHPVQLDVEPDECGMDRRRSARIDIDALHAAVEANHSADVVPSSSDVASAASQERDPNVLQASQVQMFRPRPPSEAPVNPIRRVRLTKLKLSSSSETTQIQTTPESNRLASRRRLRAHASQNATQSNQAASLCTGGPPSLTQM